MRIAGIAFHIVGIIMLLFGATLFVRQGSILAIIPIGSALGLVGSLVFDVLSCRNG